jgi:hypothetical protein
MGANLSISVKIGEGGNHDIFFRYMKNQKGGEIKIHLDGKLIDEVDTFDKISNNFLWEKVATTNLTKGEHTLTLENVAGFNAVNTFAIIPGDEMKRLRTEFVNLLADKIRVLYLLEAESNFYNSKGKDTGSFIHLFKENTSNVTANRDTNTFTKKYTGHFKTPKNSDLVSFQFLLKYPNNESYYSVKNVEITPSFRKYFMFTSDFERKVNSVPLATLRHSDWLNYDRDLISTSAETSNPIGGNNSLRVDLKQGNKPGWNTISTDLIPIADDAYYNASLGVSATDVKQFHSKILYFDSDKKKLGPDQYILDKRDGTFDDTFSSVLLPPTGAKYIKYQVSTKSANPIASYYILDNVKLQEIIIPIRFKANFMNNSYSVSQSWFRNLYKIGYNKTIKL